MMLALHESSQVHLDDTDLLLVSLCLLINAFLSWRYGMGMHGTLLLAGVRCLVQLFLLGLVLDQVFALGSLPLILLILGFMCFMAAVSIAGRNKRIFPGRFLIALGSITFPAFLMTAYAVFVVIQPPDWSDPRYLIPLMGMVLGNGLTAVSLAMDRFVNAMVERRREIESWLCFGAGIEEATRSFANDAIRTGMTPMINIMMVVGVVSLPGTLSGQILGGTSPGLAVRYQILILFLLAGSTALGAGLAVVWLRKTLFDSRGRLIPGIRQRRDQEDG